MTPAQIACGHSSRSPKAKKLGSARFTGPPLVSDSAMPRAMASVPKVTMNAGRRP